MAIQPRANTWLLQLAMGEQKTSLRWDSSLGAHAHTSSQPFCSRIISIDITGTPLASVIEIMEAEVDPIVRDALTKKEGVAYRLFYAETWTEAFESRTALGRIVDACLGISPEVDLSLMDLAQDEARQVLYARMYDLYKTYNTLFQDLIDAPVLAEEQPGDDIRAIESALKGMKYDQTIHGTVRQFLFNKQLSKEVGESIDLSQLSNTKTQRYWYDLYEDYRDIFDDYFGGLPLAEERAEDDIKAMQSVLEGLGYDQTLHGTPKQFLFNEQLRKEVGESIDLSQLSNTKTQQYWYSLYEDYRDIFDDYFGGLPLAEERAEDDIKAMQSVLEGLGYDQTLHGTPRQFMAGIRKSRLW